MRAQQLLPEPNKCERHSGEFVQDASHRVGRYSRGNTIAHVYHFPADIAHLFKGYENQIMGMQMSLWTERIANGSRLDFMTFPRLFAVAEAAWTPLEKRNFEYFEQKLPDWLHWLKSIGIGFYNPFDPDSTPEPWGPDKQDILKEG